MQTPQDGQQQNRPLTWEEQFDANSKGMTAQPLDASTFADEPPANPTQMKEQSFWRRLLSGKTWGEIGSNALPRGLAEAGNQIVDTMHDFATPVIERIPGFKSWYRYWAHRDYEHQSDLRLNSKAELDSTYGPRSSDPIVATSESLIQGVSTFLVARRFVPGGKLLSKNVAGALVADATAFDPHEMQLQDLLADVDVPVVKQVGELLKPDANESDAVARIRRSVGGFLFGQAIDAVLWAAKGVKGAVLRKAGKAGGEKLVEESAKKLEEIADGTYTPPDAHIVARPTQDGLWTAQINPESPATKMLEGMPAETPAAGATAEGVEHAKAPMFESRGDAELYASVYNRMIDSRLGAMASASADQVAQVQTLAKAIKAGDQEAVESALQASHFNFSYTKTHPQVAAMVDALSVEFNGLFSKASKITVHDEAVLGAVERFYNRFTQEELPTALKNLNATSMEITVRRAIWDAAMLDYTRQFTTLSRLMEQRPWDVVLQEEAKRLLGMARFSGENARAISADVARAQRFRQVDLGGLLQKIKNRVVGAPKEAPGASKVDVGGVEQTPTGPKLSSKMSGDVNASTADPGLPPDIAGMKFRDLKEWGRIMRMAGDEPWRVFEAGAKQTQTIVNPSRFYALTTTFINNLLSGPPTMLSVPTSGMTLSAFQAGARSIGGFLTGNRSMAREGWDTIYGLWKYRTENLRTAWRATLAGHSLTRPPETREIPQFFKGEAGSTAAKVNDAAVTVATAPSRVITGGDEFTRVANYRAIVRAKVLREARAMGLDDAAAEARVADAMREAFDPNTGAARLVEPLQYAEVPTLSGPVGAKTQAVLELINRVPALKWVAPFVRTGSHVFDFTHQVTPGINFFNATARKMWQAGGEERAMLMGQMTLASGAYALAGGMWLSGNLTGGAPKEPGLRERWLALHPEYSLKVGDEWISYRRLEPMATMLGLVADMAEIATNSPDDPNSQNAPWAVLSAITKNLSDKTYMRGLMEFADAVGSGEPWKTKRWISTLAMGFVPYSQMQRALNPDPTMREARDLISTIQAQTPGWSESLPKKYDLFGDPVYKAPGLVNRGVNPLRFQPANDEDHQMVNDAVYSLSRSHAKMKPTLPSGIDLRDPKYRNAKGVSPWDRFNELMGNGFDGKRKSFFEATHELVMSKTWQQASAGTEEFPGGTRWDAFARLKGQYEHAALMQTIREFKQLRLDNTLQELRKRGAHFGGETGVRKAERLFEQRAR